MILIQQEVYTAALCGSFGRRWHCCIVLPTKFQVSSNSRYHMIHRHLHSGRRNIFRGTQHDVDPNGEKLHHRTCCTACLCVSVRARVCCHPTVEIMDAGLPVHHSVLCGRRCKKGHKEVEAKHRSFLFVMLCEYLVQKSVRSVHCTTVIIWS